MRIDSETFEKHVRRLAAENPKYVYDNTNGCNYVRDDGDGNWCGDCLIGRALIACGVPGLQLRAIDTARPISGDGLIVDGEARTVLQHYRVSADVAEWAEIVQQHQDHQHTWGDSVRAADRLMLVAEPGRAINVRRSVHQYDCAS